MPVSAFWHDTTSTNNNYYYSAAANFVQLILFTNTSSKHKGQLTFLKDFRFLYEEDGEAQDQEFHEFVVFGDLRWSFGSYCVREQASTPHNGQFRCGHHIFVIVFEHSARDCKGIKHFFFEIR